MLLLLVQQAVLDREHLDVAAHEAAEGVLQRANDGILLSADRNNALTPRGCASWGGITAAASPSSSRPSQYWAPVRCLKDWLDERAELIVCVHCHA